MNATLSCEIGGIKGSRSVYESEGTFPLLRLVALDSLSDYLHIMSISTTSTESIASATNDSSDAYSLWVLPRERSPTEEEEERAREHSLNKGNKTAIGYDRPTEWYNPGDISYEKKDWYQRLDRHNRDNHWEFRDEIHIAQDYDRQLKLNSAKGIVSQLGLSNLHEQAVLDRLFEIDGRRFGERTEAVVFCLCAIVLNDEAEDRYDSEKIYHPARSNPNNDNEFVRVQNQLVESFGPLTESRLHSIYAKLKQGRPPLRDDDETQQFISANSVVQRRPSFAPDHTLPQPTGEV